MRAQISFRPVDRSIIVGRGVLDLLGRPNRICFLIDWGNASIAIKECPEGVQPSWLVPEGYYEKPGMKMRIYGTEFITQMLQLHMAKGRQAEAEGNGVWQIDKVLTGPKKMSVRFIGEYDEEHKAVKFQL